MTGVIDRLQDITESVLEDFFEDEFSPVENETWISRDAITALIRFSEAWYGAAAATCTPTLARGIAATMFECAPDELSEDELADALGEVINMIGGHVKLMLPRGTRMSVPTIHPTANVAPAVPGGRIVWCNAFDCAGERLAITFFSCGEPE